MADDAQRPSTVSWRVGQERDRAAEDPRTAALLAGAKRLAGSRPRGTWPPEFVGMIKDGPSDGSTAVGGGGVS